MPILKLVIYGVLRFCAQDEAPSNTIISQSAAVEWLALLPGPNFEFEMFYSCIAFVAFLSIFE